MLPALQVLEALPAMDFKKTYHLHPAMRLIHNSVQKERTVKLVFALCLMTAAVTVPYFNKSRNNFIYGSCLLAFIIGLQLLYQVIRRSRAADERLLNLLNKNPEQIVWVFSLTTQTMPFGFHLWDTGTMYFKLLDGDEITVSLPAKKLKMVSKFLNRLLPHASFGYSEERQAQYENDPKSLLKK